MPPERGEDGKFLPRREPAATPERQQLAVAIASVAAIERALADLAAARAKAPDRFALGVTVDRLTEKLAEAEAAEPQALIAGLNAESLTIDTSVSLARRELRRAEADHARSKEIAGALAREQALLEDRLSRARENRAIALAEVLRGDPAVIALFEAYHATQDALHELAQVLDEVSSAHGTPPQFRYWESIRTYPPQDFASVAAWRRAIATLAADAGAVLPAVK